jgi:GNAT superfamily N-acetyltransferase
MIRDPGGERPEPPPGLEIRTAVDAGSIADAEALIAESFGADDPPGSMLGPKAISDRFQVWVGRVDGRPVSTATAYVSDGFVGVYAVATTPIARGRGYGAALSWTATLYRPDLPATLQASPMGQPVYERMGYRTVARFTVWEHERR